jgi:hypothetical protein
VDNQAVEKSKGCPLKTHADADSSHAAHVRTVQYCTGLYCTVLYCTVLYCTVLYCTVLYCTVLYCTVLYCTVLYCTVLYCTVLYFTVLYCTLLPYAVLCCTPQQIEIITATLCCSFSPLPSYCGVFLTSAERMRLFQPP